MRVLPRAMWAMLAAAMTSPLERLTRLTQELQGAHGFSELVQLLVEGCTDLLDTPRASIRLLDPSGTKLMAVCRAGSPLHLDPAEAFRVGEGLVGWIVEHRASLRTGDADTDARFAARPGMMGPVRSYLGVPLVAGESTLGVLSASNPKPDYFTVEHEQLMTLMAGIAAPHIEIARRDFVVRDSLTGLYNHAHFQQTLDRELERSLTYGLPFSVLLLDVDGFTKVNDARGHQVGDAMLMALSDSLLGRGAAEGAGFRLRGQDFVARYGGDEVALILPHTPKAGGEAKAEMLRAHIEAADLGSLALPKQTVSVGVAAAPDDAWDRASLISACEHALKAAKRRGGNCVVGYSRALAVASALETSMAIDIDKLIALEATIEGRRFDFVYQPIVDAFSHEPIAYEALCRPRDPIFAGPADLFETAEYASRLTDLGRACRLVSTAPVDQLPESCSLFINLHPRELDPALLHEDVVRRWARRCVFEITETAAIEDYDRVRAVIATLRESGCRIALDDLGSGYAGLNSLAQLQPDFVKLDIALIRRIHTKSSTRRLVKHILEFCSAESIPVISEGVETAEEHDMVRQIGCPLMQGDYLAPPGPAFPAVRPPTS